MRLAFTSDLHRGFGTNTSRIHDKFFKQLADEKFDVLVLAGDLGSHTQQHVEQLFRAVRRALPGKPIIAVKGNHDYWHMPKYKVVKQSLGNKRRHWLELVIEYGIIGAHKGCHSWNSDDGKTVVFWNNWYEMLGPDRGTKDSWFLTIEEEIALRQEDTQSFTEYLDYFAGKPADVLIQHMPIVSPNVRMNPYDGQTYMWRVMQEQDMLPKVYIHGHTHRDRDEVIDGTRVLMCGSDYDRPKYKIIEV